MNIKIVDVFWDRIYLNIIFECDSEENNVFLVSNTQKIELDLQKIKENKYKSVINITNLANIVMLKNENYEFIAKKNGKNHFRRLSKSILFC